MKDNKVEPDVIICLSFGKRTSEVGLSNKFLITKIINFYKKNPLPLIIQKDCADYFPKDIKINKIISNHSKSGKYLNTQEVLRQSIYYCFKNNFKKALVFAHTHHIPRIKNDFAYFNFDFKIADTKGCPYDPKSSQIWTRNKYYFLLREFIVKIYYIIQPV